MFASRKPLAIALALVMVLAMLVPVAMAAPQWVHGVKITAPTTAAPAYVNPAKPVADPTKPDVQGDAGFTIKWDLTIAGTQVDDIEVQYRAIDPNGWIVVWTNKTIVASNALKTGVNSMSSGVIYPSWLYGWYTIEVCARDLGAPPAQGEWFCDTQAKALLIDTDDPGVRLIKPAQDAWISGMDYLLVGKAWDPEWAENDSLLRYGGIKAAWFDYCVLSNVQGDKCGPNDKSWITIAQGVKTPGIPDQYDARWDTTQVPDDEGRVRFCATDFVDRMDCDKHRVHVVNRFSISLRPGWNLISTPLLLYSDAISDTLSHLHNSATNSPTWESVYAMTNTNADQPNVYTWDFRTSAGVGGLAKIEHGRGYWIKMNAPGTLTFVGNWKSTGPQAPPEYRVFEGWNLIGYTHWGQPTSAWWTDKTVIDYLGMPLAPAVEKLWLYDAWSETYIPLYLGDTMAKGYGYWLATAEGGTINP